jgi:dihydrofolate synthase / folylpolyglutamate synthase
MSHQLHTLADAQAVLEPLRPQYNPDFVYSLEHIKEAMEDLGNPQNDLRVVHVVGTSGKTSTAYYIAALLTAAGYKVGLTVSPHVYALNERIQIGMRPLVEEVFARALGEFLDILEQHGHTLSYFEVLTAYAYWYFAREHVDFVVVEAGMGGLLDATSVATAPNKVCVITDIGLDHITSLGGTLAEIAMHKAGIIHLHNSVFCYQQPPAATEVIEHVARQKQADLHVLADSAARTDEDSLPWFQQRNLGLAVAVAEALQEEQGKPLTPAMIAKAAATVIPGRMETRYWNGKTIILDGAHNPQKLHALARSLHVHWPQHDIAVLVSLAAARDYRLSGNVNQLAALGKHFITTAFKAEEYDPHNSVGAAELAGLLAEEHAGSVEAYPNLKAAVQRLLDRPEPVLVITGSLYLLHRVRPLLP